MSYLIDRTQRAGVERKKEKTSLRGFTRNFLILTSHRKAYIYAHTFQLSTHLVEPMCSQYASDEAAVCSYNLIGQVITFLTGKKTQY